MGKKKKAEAVKLGALKMASEEHEELLDEIHRRDCIEHEDAVEQSMATRKTTVRARRARVRVTRQAMTSEPCRTGDRRARQ